MSIKFVRFPETVTFAAVLNGLEKINTDRFDGAFEVSHKRHHGRFGGALITLRHHQFEFDFWLDDENLLSWG